MKVAVIGSGISGLAAAHRLRAQAHVTLYEAGPYFGGHSNTLDVELPNAQGQLVRHGVDTGFLVFNERTYPGLIALLHELGVPAARSDMSFSVQVPGAGLGGQGLEWTGANLATVFAQRSNLLRPKFWRMLREVLRFNSLCTAIALANEEGALAQPLSDFLQQHGFDASFRQADVPQYLERTRRYDYDMIIDMFAQSLSPGAEQTYMWGSQAADEKGNQNSAGIKNKAIDAVIAKLIVSKNRDDIVLYSKVLDRLLRAGYYVVPTYGKHTDNVAYWKFYEHGPLPSNAIGIDYWWANKDKQAQVMQYLGK